MLNNDTTRQETEDEKEIHLTYNFYIGFQQIDVVIAFLSQIISVWVCACHGSLKIGFGNVCS